MGPFIGAIDQGTTSTRFAVVDGDGVLVAMAQREHRQILPRPGWVEHDASEILSNTYEVITEALDRAGIDAPDLSGVGITNQRETTVLWDKTSGEPVTNAIVWQDTRTANLVKTIASLYGEDALVDRTGLPPATYFSGPKIRWLFDRHPELHERAKRGEIAFGTMDSWLAWNLSGRHVTDVTNASRTMLMDIRTLDWDDSLLEALGVPRRILPEIVPSIGDIGPCTGVLAGTNLTTILGDQHAALVGQGGFAPGDTKVTYGTGAFLVSNTGTEIVRSQSGLITTVAYQFSGEAPVYALEGSVAVAGSAVQWLRDNLGLIASAQEVETLALSVPDNGDVYFVPAFSGLFAPHWRDDARGVLVGMTRYTNKAHIARAVLEATAFQTNDVLDAMMDDTQRKLPEVRVDGAMAENSLLMGFQADIANTDVVVPSVTETTVLGAAFGAGLATGVWSGTDKVTHQLDEAVRYRPTMTSDRREELLAGWSKAIDRSLNWIDS